MLAPTGGIDAGSPMVLSSTNLGTGSYKVTFARDVTGCTPVASVHGGGYFASAYVNGDSVYGNTYSAGGSAINLYWSLTLEC